ncbi:Gfo/Idh/MocA family oxidoreductase [Bacillus inaquosorum]|uniref:Gfo/Idh/MocA family oxidoreductase n=1 Tax=Bacillus inaquosorum TaxID=483913 RepID=UPI0022819F0B|nr:Gfo/Idh/MocA family oxidoreductase [Bacillus inaquosorum]MCY8694368.1 Gfo/Idh/MocA family oxidoreductase [Bacillus inaquosorum]MCY8850796.1 Gfo/Idh/MocA family oxidoreductase [Bacillus inaquosorum]
MVKIGGKTDTLGNGRRRPGKSNWIHSSLQRHCVIITSNLAAGAFDIIPKRGKEFGINLHVSPERFYSDFRNIIEEAKREDGIEAVSVATPNATHYEICKAALSTGLHVVCENLSFTIEEAKELEGLAKKNTGCRHCIWLFRALNGRTGPPADRKWGLGENRMIHMQFAHGFHSDQVELHNPSTKCEICRF